MTEQDVWVEGWEGLSARAADLAPIALLPCATCSSRVGCPSALEDSVLGNDVFQVFQGVWPPGSCGLEPAVTTTN